MLFVYQCACLAKCRHRGKPLSRLFSRLVFPVFTIFVRISVDLSGQADGMLRNPRRLVSDSDDNDKNIGLYSHLPMHTMTNPLEM